MINARRVLIAAVVFVMGIMAGKPIVIALDQAVAASAYEQPAS